MLVKDASQLVIENLGPGTARRTISHAPSMSDVYGQPGHASQAAR